MHILIQIHLHNIYKNQITGIQNRSKNYHNSYKYELFLVNNFIYYINIVLYRDFKNSLIIHEENTKKNHKRVVSLYVDKDFPSFT